MSSPSQPAGADPGWSRALKLVTGHDVDLRSLCDGHALINPTLICLDKGGSNGSSLVMGNNAGQPAIDRLVQEVTSLAELMPSLQAARLGLMDIDQLRQAATLMERQSSALTGLDTSAQQLLAETAASGDGSHGQTRRGLATEVQRLQLEVSTQAESLQHSGERPITSVINDAVHALSSFGTRMARAFYAAKPDLVEVATTFWEGANTNLRAYWEANGWGPQGPMSRLFDTAPQMAETLWRAAMAGYTSAGLPGLPAGTPTVAADLDDGWSAFGAALTLRLGQTLDAMDDEANAAFAELSRSYRAALEALGADASMPDDAPAAAGTAFLSQPQPLSPLVVASDLAPMTPGLQLTPMQARIPMQ